MKLDKKSVKYSEIRAALIGWVRYEGLYCVAAMDIRQVNFSGLNNGATAARVLGVNAREKFYEAPPDATLKIEALYQDILKKTKKKWTCKHQLFILVSEPDALAYVLRPLITNPVIVVLNPEKNKVHVEYYTAKTIFSGIHLRRMAKYFGKLLPGNLVDSDKKEKANEKK